MPTTPTQIRDLIIHLLAGATGQPDEHWRKIVGDVEPLPLAINVMSNWRVDLHGSEGNVVAVQAAIALMRADHPHVVG